MSLLEQDLRRHPPRELPIALGQVLANAKPGRMTAEHAEALNRIYAGLSPADQLRCRDEMHRCREAKRAQTEALVA